MWNQVLKKVETIKYLDRMLCFYISDFPVAGFNLQREQIKWVLSTVLLSVVPIGRLH